MTYKADRAPDGSLEAQAMEVACEEARSLRTQATEVGVFARALGTCPHLAQEEAGRLNARAAAILHVDTAAVICSTAALGELPVKADRESKKRFRDTLRDHPDLVSINAGRSRLSLARQAGITCMAEDTAATIRAENSLEVALAHQIAAAHNAAMLLQARAMDVLDAHRQSQFRNSRLCADAVRMVNASGRMMDATQKAALVLNRLRTAGAQTLVVQHVHVGDGGQAVVAGKMRAAGRRKDKAGGR